MKDRIEKRCKEIANYVISNSTTVRLTAEKFGISKSTVHKDIIERLQTISPNLAKKTREVLERNKKERHIRGGMATKRKYQMLRNDVK